MKYEMLWIPIDKNLRGRGFRQNNNFAFAKDASVVELSLFELKNSVGTMPIGFLVEKERVFLAGLLGLETNRNLFVDSAGNWLSRYVPAMFREYPFRLIDVKVSGEMKKTIGVLEDAPTIVEEKDGIPFFDEEGKLSKSILKIADFMNQKLISETLTRQACKVIQDLGLLIPWDLAYIRSTKNGPKKQILTGLSRVDEQKFKNLSDKDLLHLNKVHGAAIIFAHFFSGEMVYQLNKLFLADEPGRATEQELKELGDSIFAEEQLSDFELNFD
tara:strand:- start:4524 stop:5339 length:816 start_codon:yes stop_codon:yes gene_type:complete